MLSPIIPILPFQYQLIPISPMKNWAVYQKMVSHSSRTKKGVIFSPKSLGSQISWFPNLSLCNGVTNQKDLESLWLDYAQNTEIYIVYIYIFTLLLTQCLSSGYVKIAIEHGHGNSGFTHW